MNILEELLTKGFFPIQLPPNFNSNSFGKNHEKINVGINKIFSADNKKNPYKEWTRTDKYSVARSSYYRRTTNILNPLSYFIIAKLIADNWNEINIHFKKSDLSLSKPIIGEKSIRAITLTKFSQLYEKKILDSSGYKYALITDISSYFPSIYTHSIPWALHSKEVSKSNIKGPLLLGDKIDLYCRNAQDGQTVGLPIGSDTSHIISEIIGTAIDLELIKRLSTYPKGFRYVDDFCLFFTNKPEAEKTLAILTSIFNNYELNINASKTKIMETKDLIEESWRYGIKKLKISPEIKSQRNDIHNFFSSIFTLEKKYKDESIAKYSMKQLSSNIIKKDNWDILESYLLKIAYAFPNTIEIVSRFLVTYNYFNYKLDKRNIKRFITSLLEEHSNSSHHNEVCWLLWLTKELTIKPYQRTINQVLDMDNNISLIILLDMVNKELINKKHIPDELLSKFISTDELKNSGWLVSYEAGKRNWLGNDNLEFIKKDKGFKVLLENGVSFYDENTPPPLLFNRKEYEVLNSSETPPPIEDINILLNSDHDISEEFEFNELDEEYFDNSENIFGDSDSPLYDE
ncbi:MULTISPECIES: RNA-directed DNA polymerase [Proteus]|uniref:RNA-directed DNA polymerase n=2 Tax=Proteus penneri TaxID=102862 RepID=A0ABS0VZP4_9GAMM|nr:RNA-directed DNA polymerase [Proteus penneri]MBJ2116529.1 RNA-directed DNA polymerase [Proteus penneri]NBN03697.1 hypothetical protein [Proteus sp. G2665]SUC00914.1 Reverse transcriptase (RNA-dependent DNA polymerase) [Proteus penneri]